MPPVFDDIERSGREQVREFLHAILGDAGQLDTEVLVIEQVGHEMDPEGRIADEPRAGPVLTGKDVHVVTLVHIRVLVDRFRLASESCRRGAGGRSSGLRSSCHSPMYSSALNCPPLWPQGSLLLAAA